MSCLPAAGPLLLLLLQSRAHGIFCCCFAGNPYTTCCGDRSAGCPLQCSSVWHSLPVLTVEEHFRVAVGTDEGANGPHKCRLWPSAQGSGLRVICQWSQPNKFYNHLSLRGHRHAPRSQSGQDLEAAATARQALDRLVETHTLVVFRPKRLVLGPANQGVSSVFCPPTPGTAAMRRSQDRLCARMQLFFVVDSSWQACRACCGARAADLG